MRSSRYRAATHTRRLLVHWSSAAMIALALQCGGTETHNEDGGPDTTPPTVISTSPSANASDVPVNAVIQATFSEDIEPASLTMASFTLSKGPNRVLGAISYADRTAVFSPIASLAYDTVYTAKLTYDVTDRAGNLLTPVHTWTFTTEVRPANLPDTPQRPDITVGDGLLVLDWPTSPQATSYNLYWSWTTGVVSMHGDPLIHVTGPHVHSGLTNGTTYHYVLTAVNEFGESNPSEAVSGTPVTGAIPPQPPAGVKATAGDARVILDWEERTEATAYKVYWSVLSGVDRYSENSSNVSAPPFDHTGLANGLTTFYVVTSLNEYGESAESDTVAGTPNKDQLTPPTGVKAAPGIGRVIISWNAVDRATGYNLYWSMTSGVTPEDGTPVSSVTSPYCHTGLASGRTIHYVITAVNQAGEGPPSNEVSAIALPSIPDLPHKPGSSEQPPFPIKPRE